MSNTPNKTKALVQDEPSTSLATSGDQTPCTPFDPSITAVANGQVEGAWSITALGDDWEPEGIFVLPEGEAMQVGRGSAIRVQSADGWHHCEFPQPGVLHGPVVWTMAEATEEAQLLKPHTSPRPAALMTGIVVEILCLGVVLIHEEFRLNLDANLARMTFGTIIASAGVMAITSACLNKFRPLTIASVNQRVSTTLRMPRSVLHALGAPQSHLKLVAPERPMDDLDREIQGHLYGYRAQRAQLATKKIASGPLVEHTAAMIDEIETRLRGGTTALREDDLRQTYLALIQRAEGDILKLLHRQEAKEAEGVARDMSALIQQMDRHKG